MRKTYLLFTFSLLASTITFSQVVSGDEPGKTETQKAQVINMKKVNWDKIQAVLAGVDSSLYKIINQKSSSAKPARLGTGTFSRLEPIRIFSSREVTFTKKNMIEVIAAPQFQRGGEIETIRLIWTAEALKRPDMAKKVEELNQLLNSFK